MSEHINIAKIKELQGIIDAFVKRQKEIRKEIQESDDYKQKNILDIERKTNTAILRISHWIMMELKGYDFEHKVNIDPEYPYWVERVFGFYCNQHTADILGLEEDKYLTPTYNSSCKYPKYTPQRGLYYYIYNRLFPENKGGIFCFNEEDSVENEVWRTRFKSMIHEEFQRWWKMKN